MHRTNIFNYDKITGGGEIIGRKPKFRAEYERKIEDIILFFTDRGENKTTCSDAEIAEICQKSGIDTNTKYIERARRRLGLASGGRAGRKSDDLRRQHELDVAVLSRMFGQGRPPGGELAWQKYKSQKDFAKKEKQDRWMILGDQHGCVMPWAAALALIMMLNLSTIIK